MRGRTPTRKKGAYTPAARNSLAPSGRRASGVEPETPASTLDALEVPAVLNAAGLDLALLLVERDARIALLIGRYAGVAVGAQLNRFGG